MVRHSPSRRIVVVVVRPVEDLAHRMAMSTPRRYREVAAGG
jgi:hypothetical protein